MRLDWNMCKAFPIKAGITNTLTTKGVIHFFVIFILLGKDTRQYGRIGRAQVLREWEIRILVPGRVEPMSYKIDTCYFLAWH